MKTILILCTGNSCRSQMAEGLLKSFEKDLIVWSAGTEPANAVHPKAIEVMHEIGIDISMNVPRKVDEFLDKQIDYLVTVCDAAVETCPVFNGSISNRLHIGFEDPDKAIGSEEEILNKFREIRDLIKVGFVDFYTNRIRK